MNEDRTFISQWRDYAAVGRTCTEPQTFRLVTDRRSTLTDTDIFNGVCFNREILSGFSGRVCEINRRISYASEVLLEKKRSLTVGVVPLTVSNLRRSRPFEI